RTVDDVRQIWSARKQLISIVEEQRWMYAINEAIKRRTRRLNHHECARRQERDSFTRMALGHLGIAALEDQNRGERRDVMHPAERGPQRDNGQGDLVMNDDVFRELRHRRIQQLTRVDRLVQRLNLTALDPLFLFETQLRKLFTQNIQVFAQLSRQRRKPALMFSAWQLDDGCKRLLLLTLLALGLLTGFAFFALGCFAGFAFLTLLFLVLLLLFALLLFLGAILAASEFTPFFTRLLLDLFDDGLDHRLGRGLVDAVLLGVAGDALDVEHPLDRGQPTQAFDLDLEAARLLLVTDGEFDDAGLWLQGRCSFMSA